MSTNLDCFEVEDQFLSFYQMCLKEHCRHFPSPRKFRVDQSTCGATQVLVKRLKKIYPQSLKIGSVILVLDWPNWQQGLGPYRILLHQQREQGHEQR
jgi:hypothetical protein